jgi:hypothetical protein
LSKLTPGRAALGLVGLAIGVVGVLALREATLSTHEAAAGRATVMVVSAKTHGGEQGQTLAEMVEAQLLTCRLEVTSDLGPIESLGDGRFRTELVPAMDRTNRRQFRGCVEDFVTDHLQIDVLELEGVN